MGFHHELDESGVHEGFAVGYVPRDWVPVRARRVEGGFPVVQARDPLTPRRPKRFANHYRASAPLREIGSVRADREHEIVGVCIIGAGCTCGWRSEYYELGTPCVYQPCTLNLEVYLQRRTELLFRAHVEAVNAEVLRPESAKLQPDCESKTRLFKAIKAGDRVRLMYTVCVWHDVIEAPRMVNGRAVLTVAPFSPPLPDGLASYTYPLDLVVEHETAARTRSTELWQGRAGGGAPGGDRGTTGGSMVAK
jgi:hypothetical protein